MNLKNGDLHLIFSDTINRCQVWRKGEPNEMLYQCMMRNDTVRRWFLKWGWCPRGEYLLGSPSKVHAPAFGEWFTPMFDLSKNGPMYQNQRVGIGIHGGGTGLPNPYAAQQGWVPTHGCLRCQNASNAELARLIKECQSTGCKAYIAVTGDAG